jgi:hypothetical protein
MLDLAVVGTALDRIGIGLEPVQLQRAIRERYEVIYGEIEDRANNLCSRGY